MTLQDRQVTKSATVQDLLALCQVVVPDRNLISTMTVGMFTDTETDRFVSIAQIDDVVTNDDRFRVTLDVDTDDDVGIGRAGSADSIRCDRRLCLDAVIISIVSANGGDRDDSAISRLLFREVFCTSSHVIACAATGRTERRRAQVFNTTDGVRLDVKAFGVLNTNHNHTFADFDMIKKRQKNWSVIDGRHRRTIDSAAGVVDNLPVFNDG
mmetsp:Transcript_10326/g.24800  ORF Transcript_10326/g.24800 Transcript_10326/m.24800 type:complete len:211 (+) Transcript_10326:336-968(+)